MGEANSDHIVAATIPADLFLGAYDALEAARPGSIPTALVSASRNAKFVFRRLEITELFDNVVDSNLITPDKPAPDVYLAAADVLTIAPARRLGIEDAAAGLDSIRAAEMVSLGIGSPAVLCRADAVIGSIADCKLADDVRGRS